jgi:hypothetical protein
LCEIIILFTHFQESHLLTFASGLVVLRGVLGAELAATVIANFNKVSEWKDNIIIRNLLSLAWPRPEGARGLLVPVSKLTRSPLASTVIVYLPVLGLTWRSKSDMAIIGDELEVCVAFCHVSL